MWVIKHIFISGSVFDRGHRWQFWCLKHTNCGECAERGVCSVMAVCQTYSNPPIHYHRVLIQHEQDKLFVCQLPGNVWVKILKTLDTLQWHWNCAYFWTFIGLQSQNIQSESESGEWDFEVLHLQTIHWAIPL